MKMAEFLALSDDEKVKALKDYEGDYDKATEGKGECSVCGNKADTGDFCFGCHHLVCPDCIEIEPHLSSCLEK